MRHTWYINIIIAFTILLFITSLYHRNAHVDDAWIGEQAYWMSEIGYVKSELMRGITQQEEKNLVHHKLFTLNGALFIKIFGFSLWSLKSVSIVWYIVFLFYFHKFLQQALNNTYFSLLGLMFMVVHSFMFEYAFVYRPEIMVMTLGFFSFIFLIRIYNNNEQSNLTNIFLASLFAGLAAVSHLNGLIFIMAGPLILLYLKQIKKAVLFGCLSLLPLMIYFYDFKSFNDINFWWYQFGHSPALLDESHTLATKLFNKILDEHKMFLHSPKEIIFTLLFVFLFYISYNQLKKINFIITYLFLLILSLSLISMHNTSRYTIMYLPYMVIICVFSIKYLIEKENRTALIVYKTLLSLFLIIHTFYNIQISTKKHDTKELREMSLELFGDRSFDLKIIAPMQFIFNEIKYFDRIQSDLGYMDRVRSGEIQNFSDFLCIAQSNNINYIFIDEVFADFMKLSKSQTQIDSSIYSKWKTLPKYVILKNKFSN